MLRPGNQDTYISRRVNLPTAKSHAELVSDVEPKIKAQAFFSARVAEAHILDRLRRISDGYSRGEFGLGEARNRLKDFLRAEGYDPHQGGMRNLASTGRLNLILKQNAAMAKAAGEWKRMHDPDAMKVFPYVRYHARSDGRTRSEHAHLDGRIFRKDDPFLSTHTPPWEFNCRCWLEEISEKEAGKTPDLIQDPTPPDKVTVDSKSGFQFDPAHAFEEFEFSAIKDPRLREQAKAGVEKILAGESPTSPTSPIAPVETHEQHVAKRQAQRQAAYEKRLNSWSAAMQKDGVQQDVVVEMKKLYTPQMAKFGKPPRMIAKQSRGYFYLNKNKIEFDPNNGHSLDTCRHEFGHWVDYHTRLKPFPRTWTELNNQCAAFNAACDADWKRLEGMALKKYACGIRAFSQYVSINPTNPNLNEGDYFEDVSQRLFGKSYGQLDAKEDYIVLQYMDSIGSITKARLGGGHTKKEYENSYGNGEHFANAVAMWKRGDTVFKLDFPDTWDYINNVMKKGEWK